MFCPMCKAEYRQGITTCADCEVVLVPSLLPTEKPNEHPAAIGPLQPLWEGEDLALHTSLLETLKRAMIRYFDGPVSLYVDPFPGIRPQARFGYKVVVLASDFPAAKQILENLLDEEPNDELELPEQPEPLPASAQPRNAGDEQPTSEVWRGQDEEFSRFLQDALRENDMPLRVTSSGTDTVVFVRPSDAARTKEIVRELSEASPPR